jgi:hypothetical protein
VVRVTPPPALPCESRIERVVVYARGAVVTRRVSLPEGLPEGPLVISVGGVTPQAEAGSVRAIAEGDREVTALEAHLVLPASPAAPGALVERVRSLDLELERLRAEQESLLELRGALAGISIDPGLRRWARIADPAARFGDALAVSATLDAEIARVDALLRASTTALEDNHRAREAAAIAAAQGTSTELAGPGGPWMEVRVRLSAGPAPGPLAIEYVVRAARWWPAYTARFTAAATRVAFAVDAFICQASGEDWSGVHLALATADLAQDARLPELASLRFGRAQPPPRRGYRPAPIGLDVMFEGYDRAAQPRQGAPVQGAAASKTFPQASAVTLDQIAQSIGGLAGEVATRQADPDTGRPLMLSESTRSTGAVPPPPQASPAPPPSLRNPAMEKPIVRRRVASLPAPAKSAGFLSGLLSGSSDGRFAAGLEEESEGFAAARGETEAAEPPILEPGEDWLDFDTLVLPDATDHARRGRLARPPKPSGAPALGNVEGAPAPPLARDPLEARGRFDHRYDAEGTADVPSSAKPHRVAVTAGEAPATPRFVAVPREVAEVFRRAEIQNPLAAPLLSGPVDVFLDGALLATMILDFVDRAGFIHLGLGVEERIRVARNARVEESTAGLLGGSAVVDHAVTVELSSSLGQKATVEVLERVPVTDDKDVDVKVTYARPEAERYTQAERGSVLRRGLSFKVEVLAGAKAKIELGYRVTLPAKSEIVGGNRRE